jgi:hypothetical protein
MEWFDLVDDFERGVLELPNGLELAAIDDGTRFLFVWRDE